MKPILDPCCGSRMFWFDKKDERAVFTDKRSEQHTLQRRKDIGGLTDLLSRPDVPTPLFRGMDDELPHWRKQLKAVGNGQDPIVMATAYNLLSGA